MKRLLGITAALAGLGAAAWWVKKNVTVDIKAEPESPEEEAALDAMEAEAEAKTEAELKAAEGDVFKTAAALAKGWVRRHVTVTRTPDEPEAEEAPEEEPTEEVYADPADPAPVEDADPAAPAPVEDAAPAAPADDVPNPNPVEAAPAAAPVDENGKLDATTIAAPEDFADWDEQGCKG